MRFAFGLLKPDCLKRGLTEEVLKTIEGNGFAIVSTKKVRLTKNEIDVIYGCCRDKDFYEGLTKAYCSGDVVVFIVEADDAINKLNDLVGNKEPSLAAKHSIRHIFGLDVRHNIIHSTEDEMTFWEEVKLFFSNEELMHIAPALAEEQLVGV